MTVRSARNNNPVDEETPEARIVRLRREARRRHYYKNREKEIARSSLYNKENRKRVADNAVKRRAFKTPIHEVLYWNAKNRAKAKGIAFDLLPEDIVVPEMCPVFGTPLVVATGHAKDGSPSIDRIIPEHGYVRGNIAVISHKANTIKSNATLEELEMVCAFMRRVRNAS